MTTMPTTDEIHLIHELVTRAIKQDVITYIYANALAMALVERRHSLDLQRMRHMHIDQFHPDVRQLLNDPAFQGRPMHSLKAFIL